MPSQGFDDEVGMILKQIYPPTMMKDLEANSQDAIIEIAQAFPYQPSAESAGLNRFHQVWTPHSDAPLFFCCTHLHEMR